MVHISGDMRIGSFTENTIKCFFPLIPLRIKGGEADTAELQLGVRRFL